MELWFTENHTTNVRLSIRTDRQLYSAQSSFQRIDIFICGVRSFSHSGRL